MQVYNAIAFQCQARFVKTIMYHIEIEHGLPGRKTL